jgi:hypothetical protein
MQVLFVWVNHQQDQRFLTNQIYCLVSLAHFHQWNNRLICIQIYHQRIFFIQDFMSQMKLGTLIIGIIVVILRLNYVLLIEVLQGNLKILNVQINYV